MTKDKISSMIFPDIDEEVCDGNQPLLNPMTGEDYNCGNGRDACPAGTYCHRVGNIAKCCQEGAGNTRAPLIDTDE